MKRWIIALALFAASCGSVNPPVVTPPQPPVTTGAVYVSLRPPVEGIVAHIGAVTCTTDVGGVALCPGVPEGDYTLVLDGVSDPFQVPPQEPFHVAANANTDVEVVLYKVVLAPTPLSISGLRFVEDGHTWVYRGFTDFRLYDRYLAGDPSLDALMAERREVGANTVRVLGMSHCWEFNPDGGCRVGVGHFYPQEHSDYYDRLRGFTDYVGSFGLRVELVVFADAQLVMPDTLAERVHLERVLRALGSAPNVLIEIANEPFKNIPGGAVAATALMEESRGWIWNDLLVASGNADFTQVGDNYQLASGDYVTFHPDRKPEWPRTSKDAYDLRDGFAGPPNWSGFHKPVISDEPMGADEVASGSRSNVPDDFAYFAAESALAGAGGTFHSTDGIFSRPLRPITKASAMAFFAAQQWVPVDAQLAPYQRGAADGGAGINNMPMEHTDALALRTFCKVVRGEEYCVVIRPASEWRAIPRDGWRVLDQSGPHGALVHLGR